MCGTAKSKNKPFLRLLSNSKTILIQAQNGLDGFIRCQQCGNYIHIIIRTGTVVAKTKGFNDNANT